jgi:hypothetical protein
MYKVKQEDLIGDIKDFPIEIVQRMVECQVEQGNKANVTVFQNKNGCGIEEGGFDWIKTKEFLAFWDYVIGNKNFNTFFEKYPKDKKESTINTIQEELLENSSDTICLKETEGTGKVISQPDQSLKYDNEKLRWDLLPLEDIEDVVKVYTEGVKKYAPNSWQNLPAGYNRYKAAMFRHLLEYEKGNTIDEETGCLHLSQVVWNAIAMLHVSKNKE